MLSFLKSLISLLCRSCYNIIYFFILFRGGFLYMNTGKRVTERSVLVLGVLLILQLVFILTKSYTSMAWIIVYFTLQNMI